MARIAAHKKLIADPLAELLLFAAIALLGASLGTLRIDLLLAHLSLSDPASVTARPDDRGQSVAGACRHTDRRSTGQAALAVWRAPGIATSGWPEGSRASTCRQ